MTKRDKRNACTYIRKIKNAMHGRDNAKAHEKKRKGNKYRLRRWACWLRCAARERGISMSYPKREIGIDPSAQEMGTTRSVREIGISRLTNSIHSVFLLCFTQRGRKCPKHDPFSIKKLGKIHINIW